MIRQWTRNLTTGLKGATIEGPEEPNARQKEAIERRRGQTNYKGSFCTYNLLRNRVRDMIQARRQSLGTGTANPRVLRRRGTDSFYSLAIMHVGGKQKKEFMTDEKKKIIPKKKKEEIRSW